MKCRFIALITLLAGLLLTPAGFAQTQLPLQYAVKFVCGKPDSRVAAPGMYFTSVNVHNPGREPIAFLKKFAVALPKRKPGKVTELIEARLGFDQAFAIECGEILSRTGSTGFAEGFVVIESKLELDVVAVYTTQGSTGVVQTMEVERVPVRKTQ